MSANNQILIKNHKGKYYLKTKLLKEEFSEEAINYAIDYIF
jgi:hypothetical protein